MTRITRSALLTLALIACAVCTATAAALIGLALFVVRAARALLGDRLTREGNRLFRLAQRLSDALERLDAAVRICIKG